MLFSQDFGVVYEYSMPDVKFDEKEFAKGFKIEGY